MTTTDWTKPKDWTKPNPATRLDIAFAATVIGTFLPPWEEIPKQFKSQNHPMAKVAALWFFMGLDNATFIPRDGIDKGAALAQIATCLRSFQPQHEHKEAGVAYLLNNFFERVVLGDGTVYVRTDDER